MLESNKTTSGVESVSSGTELESSATSGASNDSGALLRHNEKLVKENRNYAKGLGEIKEKYDALILEKRAEEEKKLLETNQHLKVIELIKSEAQELRAKLNNYETREVEGKKSLAILSELKKLGFVDNDVNREIALKMFDKAQVEIDPSTQTVIGADIAAKAFYDKFNSVGVFAKKSVGANHNASTFGTSAPAKPTGKMTMEETKNLLKQALTKQLGE
jgi:hypothetical protein